MKTFWEFAVGLGAMGVAAMTLAAVTATVEPGGPHWERATIFLFVAVGLAVFSALAALTVRAMERP